LLVSDTAELEAVGLGSHFMGHWVISFGALENIVQRSLLLALFVSAAWAASVCSHLSDLEGGIWAFPLSVGLPESYGEWSRLIFSSSKVRKGYQCSSSHFSIMNPYSLLDLFVPGGLGPLYLTFFHNHSGQYFDFIAFGSEHLGTTRHF